MEGLELVRNGDTSEIGLGYNVLNINAINAHREITPPHSKAYSFEMGALSSNNEIKNAVRGVKQEYKLEDIQMKNFDGLQSMLAILTRAMFMIYKKIKALHFGLLLDAGYNYLNKHSVRELINFIYYKISKVVSILLMPTRSRWKVEPVPPDDRCGQLNLMLN